MSPYSPANGVNLRLHSHESLSPYPNFWSLLVGYHPCPAPPTSGMPLESPQLRPERDFGVTPYNHTWVHLKSIVEHFRALLRDLRFWANFWFFESKKILIFDALARIKENEAIGLHNPIASNGHPEWFWNDKNNCIIGEISCRLKC